MFRSFNLCLDADKSGLRLKKDVHRGDKQAWDRERPRSMRSSVAATDESNGYQLKIRRDPGLGQFVLDVLYDASNGLERKFLVDFKNLSAECSKKGDRKDADLAQTYDDFRKMWGDDATLGDDLCRLERFIDKLLEEFVDSTSRAYRRRKSESSKGGKKSPNYLAAVIHDFVVRFKSGPQDMKKLGAFPSRWLEELKASYAYIASVRKGSSSAFRLNFAFDMAFEVLCGMKAKAATGGFVATSRPSADRMMLSASLLGMGK